MRAYEGVIIYIQSFLTSAIDGVRWSATGYFTLWEEIPNAHWIGCWVGFRFGLDAVQKRIISYHAANETAIPHLSNLLYSNCNDC